MAPANPAFDRAYEERLHRWSQLPLRWLQPGEPLYGVVDLGLDRYVRRGLPARHRTAVRPPQEPASGGAAACRPSCCCRCNSSTWRAWSRRSASPPCAVCGGRSTGARSPAAGAARPSRFVIAVRTGPSTHRRFRHGRTLLAVTDRRVLLVDHDHGELMAAFGRQELARTGTVRSRQPERVDLVFADGSHIAVTARSHAHARAVHTLLDGPGPH
ncbi:hypothetical protein ACFQ1I_08185 [Kitasatospora arboriphila]